MTDKKQPEALRLAIESLQRRVQEVGAAARREHERADSAMRAAQPAGAQQPGAAYAAMSKDVIREIFMAHGFTVKEGQTDLKEYVYDAAEALLQRASHGQAPAQAAPAVVAGQDVMAWMTQDGDRVVTARTMGAARRGGGAMLSSLRGYSVALVRADVDADSPTTQPAPQQEAQEPVAVPRFNCWTTNDGDSWFDHPADSQAIYDCLGNDAKVGDEYELTAGWRSVTARYRITEVVGDGEEYEVECISHQRENTAPQPSPAAQGDELESEYQRGYRQGYEQRDAEVRGALV